MDESMIPVSTVIQCMDPRLKLLSYSFLELLHTCPRKYQLTRLRATPDDEDPLAAKNQNVTFAFGHVVGDGIQDVMMGLSEEDVILRMFLGWHADLEDRNEKQVKSFYHAVAAVQQFKHIRDNGFLDDYELMEYEGKPAAELSFLIELPDGFQMRGSVDAVLRHRESGEIMVLECKTSSASSLNPANFKNSAQGIGYSIILDVIAPEVSSYKVLYLVYLTKQMCFEPLPFIKSHTQKAQWIQELLLDVEILKLYENTGVYPMYGGSCTAWFRDCEYLQVCTLSTKHIVPPRNDDVIVETNSTYKGEYSIKLTLMDVISGQLDRNALADSKRVTECVTPLSELTMIGDTLL